MYNNKMEILVAITVNANHKIANQAVCHSACQVSAVSLESLIEDQLLTSAKLS